MWCSQSFQLSPSGHREMLSSNTTLQAATSRSSPIYLFIYLPISTTDVCKTGPILFDVTFRCARKSVQALVGETRLQKSFSGNENKKMILKTKTDVYIFVCFVFWTYFVYAVVSEWLSSEQVICWLAGGSTFSLNAKSFGASRSVRLPVRQKAPTRRIKVLHGRVVLYKALWAGAAYNRNALHYSRSIHHIHLSYLWADPVGLQRVTLNGLCAGGVERQWNTYWFK